MGKKRNNYLGGGTGALLSGAWGVYSNLTTVRDLPEDASWIAKMIADPPVYAPWLLFAASVVFLAWVFWRREDEPDEDGDVSQETRGDQSPNVYGDNNTITYGGSSMSDGMKPKGVAHEKAHIKVGPTGSIQNLKIQGGSFVGDADFISNDGAIGSIDMERAVVSRKGKTDDKNPDDEPTK